MKLDKTGFSLVLNVRTAITFASIIAASLFIPHRLLGQDIQHLHIEKVQDDGMSNSVIDCINQDQNGFMWFGTREGLFRYDGYNFEAFRNLPGNPSTLVNNEIKCICAGGEKLWLGTEGGLSCINIGSGAIKNIFTPNTVQVNSITPDGKTALWIGTVSGLYRFTISTRQWQYIAALDKNAFVTSVTADGRGNLYITAKNGFYRYNPATGACKHYNPPLLYYPKQDARVQLTYNHSLIDRYGNLWMGVWDAGLVKFDPLTEKITVWSHQTDNVHLLPYKIILGQLEDPDGHIWLANKEAGLTIFDPLKNTFFSYPVDYGSDSQIAAGVLSLFRDRSGIIWIGTQNGIFKYDPHRVHLSRTDVRLKTDTGLIACNSSAISLLRDSGTLWMGMYDGLFRYDDSIKLLTDYTSQAGINKSMAVFNIVKAADGTLWFTAKNQLLKITSKPGGKTNILKTEAFSSPRISSTIYSLYIDHSKRMWLGTTGDGVYQFDPYTKKFISFNYKELSSRHRINAIQSFCELSPDSMLLGGNHTGLLLLHVRSGRFEKIRWGKESVSLSASLNINNMLRKGTDIWIATQENGLWKTDITLRSLSTLTLTNGMPSMEVQSVAAGPHNQIWAVTAAGVVQYRPDEKKINIFDKKDGIQDPNNLKLLINETGNGILLINQGRFYNFDPDDITRNISPPKVFITGLKVFDKDYNVNTARPIELDHHQNYFSLSYVALNYTQTRLNKYAYKLDGLDKNWNYAGSRRYVSYANLDEGSYTFEVKACNNDGVWNNQPAKLTITISPPFYHRWWFYGGTVLALVIMICLIYAYNIRQLKLRLEIRDKIARDLHDDIGSTLSGINIFSKMALQKMGSDTGGSTELMEKISDRTEKTMDALADIVWSINTRNDGMNNFLLKAREYLAEVLEPQGIGYEVLIKPELEHLKLAMGLRKELYLIFKETVCNAYKYSGCTFISIKLTQQRERFELSISDNGKGFDTALRSGGNGTFNMKQRAAKIKGELTIKSEKDKGTTVTLHFRIPRFR